MYNSETLKNVIKSYYNNDLVNARIDAYFEKFDKKLIDKFIFILKNNVEKNNMLLLSSECDGIKYYIEYDNGNSKLIMRREMQSYDKTSNELQELSFSTVELNFNNSNENNIAIEANILPELIISKKNNDYMNFDLLNQSKTKSVASLEAQKNEFYEYFTLNDHDMVYKQKILNTGLVEDFYVKRLKNKQYYFVTEREYLFSPYLVGYPYFKNFQKRFIIKHKGNVLTRLVEDFDVYALRDTGLETLTYKVDASPFMKKLYCDVVSDKETIFLKKKSKNPYEINQTLGGERMYKITELQLENMLENPDIGKKVFERKKRQQRQNNCFMEV